MAGSRLFLLFSLIFSGCALFQKESDVYQKQAVFLQEIINTGDSKTLYENLSPGFQQGFPPPMVATLLGRITGYCGRILELGSGKKVNDKYLYVPEFSSNKCFIQFSLSSDNKFNYLLVDRHIESVPEVSIDSDISFTDRAKELSSHYFNNSQMKGLAVGIVEDGKVSFVFHGNAGERELPLNGDSLFQIGSVTKVYNALLAAKLEETGMIALGDPISKILPPEKYRFWFEKKKRELTLEQLLSHTSGLARLPSNLAGPDHDPYSKYGEKPFLKSVENVYLNFDPGSKFHYSNWGPALSGFYFVRVGKRPYQALMKEHVLDEIGLSATGFGDEYRTRLVYGYDGEIRRDPWDLGLFAPAGGLVSSVKDQIKFLQFAIDHSNDDDHWMKRTFTIRKRINSLNAVALGWMVKDKSEERFYWHNGGTGTFSSFVGFGSNSSRGIVLLSNSNNVPVTELGFRILEDL